MIETKSQIYNFLTKKKGNIKTLTKMKPLVEFSEIPKMNINHNKEKNYLLPEGNKVPFLIKLGVMTNEGKIINSKYDKFRQINRFLEYVNDILPDILKQKTIEQSHDNTNKETSIIKIIDFGCGKSYLTFAIYHYLSVVKNLKVEIFGLDLNNDVIEHCTKLAHDCGYVTLHFACGNIEEYRNQNSIQTSKHVNDKLDLVITLHASDTATDHALAYAVEHNAKAILSVPCCQHELNLSLKKQVQDSNFNPLLKYGIIKERFSALTTDVIRAELLEKYGYKTQLLEFIDMSHTPKNILIRGVKMSSNKVINETHPFKTNGADILQSALGVNLTLEKLLKEIQ